jgi:Fur family transcriptional regulator, peroxide stress response regulator
VPVTTAEVERRLSLFSDALRSSGLRLTHQRREVAREIAGDDTHLDVEAIYAGVRRRVPTISLDTVYRTVAALVELGLVSRVNATPGPTRYDANPVRHHHFVCTRCGLIRDVFSPTLDGVKAPEETAALGTVESVKVQLRGVCKECKRKESDSER